MLKIKLLLLCLLTFIPNALAQSQQEQVEIKTTILPALPLLDNGRIKPLDSFARESLRFLSGNPALPNLTPTDSYLKLMTRKDSDEYQVIEIKNPDLKKNLGLEKNQKRFSLETLQTSSLETLLQPITANLSSGKITEKELTPLERSTLELSRQIGLLQAIRSGQHLEQAMVHQRGGAHAMNGALFQNLTAYIENPSVETEKSLFEAVISQPRDESLRLDLKLLELEVWFNKMRIFLIATLCLFLAGVAMVTLGYKKVRVGRFSAILMALPALSFIVAGFVVRVRIMGFAPVTNMYGTMLWVGSGIILFGLVLFFLYKDISLLGILFLFAAASFGLTENVPHILSPDMDPITAVLRSNLWLSIHVLTVTISYAAFSISMVLGNIALVRLILNQLDSDFLKRYAHYAYRIIQLGVLLLSAGIILGGVWADYSWGRFWGWDPKETWALIADIGFIAILHAKYIGWLKNLGILVSATIGYLLIVMAWYGVNFVLASGLHSYGFSSGGFSMILGYLFIQAGIWAIAAITHQKKLKKHA